MITANRAWLDGVPLDSLDGVWIIGMDELEPKKTQTTESMIGHGTRFLSDCRTQMQVSLRMQIEGDDQPDRLRTLDAVKTWCRGSVLEISSRPGKRLHVRCTQEPSMTSLKQGTELKAVFTAFEVPFWEDAAPSVIVGNGELHGALYVPGNADKTAADARVKNTSASACDRVSMLVGGTRFMLQGLALEAGETLAISHDEHGFVRIMIEGTDGSERSAMACRTSTSDDDLTPRCGQLNQVEVLADTDVEAVIEARGRWL